MIAMGQGEKTVDDSMRVLCLREYALVILNDQGYAMSLEPCISIVMVETLEESL